MTHPEAIQDLERIKTITKWMDTRFRIPGTNIRFGLDPLLGLIPGAGDAIAYVISALLVLLMSRHGVKGQVLFMMIGNILLDFLLGAIPLLGEVIDVGLKANTRNLRLLEKHYHEGKYQRSFGNVLGLLLLSLFLVIGAVIWGIFELFQWLL